MRSSWILIAALVVALAVAVGASSSIVVGQWPDQPYGPFTCKPGYVWREAFEGDTVCVAPEVRTQTAADNAQAAARREPGGGAYGPDTCRQGYVWREARPSDLVCVTPATRDQTAAENNQATERWEAFAPGPHTMALEVDQLLRRRSVKYYTDTCNAGGPSPIFDPEAIVVGWGQVEVDGDPCLAGVNQVAVRFDTGPLDRIAVKTIDRAVLSYDEVPGSDCYGAPCWRSGDGPPEDKPNGCVVVRIPSSDWTTAAPSGLIPYITQSAPTVTQLSPRTWQVTQAYQWQHVPGAVPLTLPGEAPISRGYGYLLTGALSLDDLTAEDNTFCASQLSSIRLHVTYTVPPSGARPPIIR